MKWYQMRWAQKYWGKEARERYRRYLQSDAWKTKRKAVLQAAGYRCRQCGAPATEVHHETYKRIYNERMSDLTALCRHCHKAAHLPKKRKRTQGNPAEKRGGSETQTTQVLSKTHSENKDWRQTQGKTQDL